jgi:hypothetical protein
MRGKEEKVDPFDLLFSGRFKALLWLLPALAICVKMRSETGIF